MNLLKKELKSERISFLYWMLGLTATVFLSMMAYPVMKGTGQDFSVFLEAMPKALLVLFGMNGLSISNAQGFYGIIYFYIVLGGILYAATLGNRIVSKEELLRTGEFLWVKPMKRTTVLLYKALSGMLLVSLLVLFLHGTVILSFLFYAKEELSHPVLFKESLTLWLLMLLYFALGFFFAASLKEEKKSSGFTLSVTLGTFLLGLLYDLWDSPSLLRPLTPFRYFPVADLVKSVSLPGLYTALTPLLTLLLFFLGLRFFKNRDIRV